jgi:hypothetical protein
MTRTVTPTRSFTSKYLANTTKKAVQGEAAFFYVRKLLLFPLRGTLFEALSMINLPSK